MTATSAQASGAERAVNNELRDGPTVGRRGTSVTGIKARLFLAFCAMAGLTIAAAAIAWYAFIAIQRSVDRITNDSVPAMAVSMRLAEKSAEIAATAPALVASADQESRVAVQARLEAESRELVNLIEGLGAAGIESQKVDGLRATQEEITAGLRALDAAVAERLHLTTQREKLVDEIAAAYSQLDAALEPLVDDAVFDLIITGEDLTTENTDAMTQLVEGGVGTIHLLLTVNAEINLAAGLLAEAGNASDPVLIQPIRERFDAAAAAIERSLSELPHLPENGELKPAVRALLDIGSGEDSLFTIRARELRADATEWETLQARRERLAEEVRSIHDALLAILTPLVDDATFDLVISAEDVTAQSSAAITGLIDGGVTILRDLLALRAEGNLAAGLLAAAANTPDRAALQPIRERFIATADHIQTRLDGLLDAPAGDELRVLAERLIGFGVGDDGIFGARERELRQLAAANGQLQEARALSIRLGDQVAELVATAQQGSDRAAVEAGGAIGDGELLLLLIIGVSIAGAAFIVLFYVAPRVIRPLESITTAMSELAAGDTTVDIPGRDRSDEIGRMAQALGVFRDTAIEVQKSNMQEIQDTRRRLSDAISSISEGFSLYDRADRLVICNDRYHAMLYPGMAEEITPGMTFEAIVRHAAESGYIKDAEGQVEDWLRQRMVRHRNPGDPHAHRRADGRWIMVSERKTEDGGTVALYSDITELKQREEELADKSNALEQLSSQLAKYLSPQVYESIFTGKQEVKVASRRKKLTVFFSDIAGFTETADRLESEDLSNLLNHYLTEMSEIALAYGATIDKYVGDAIVIFFGDPESKGVKEDALACVKMAIAMRERMRELQETWRNSGIEKPLQCRTGISTGYCTVGNFGSEDRMDYTIIGGGVNLASRLESASTPGEILISYETYAHAKDEVFCREHGEIEVKGIAYPVATYEVVDLHENLEIERKHVRADQANLKLDLDVEAMSADERAAAEQVLREALAQVSPPAKT